jgi:methylated-DNA-[protein]-cysteine S-methyltransferase
MDGYELTLFDTSVGRCGVLWGRGGIKMLQLPEGRDAATRARLLQRFPDAREAVPPPSVQHALDAIAALLRGTPDDLGTVELDMAAVPPFHRRVYDVTRRIPPGKTLSYGEVATQVGAPGAARAVGQALGRNPFPIVVPCHRVLAAGKKVGGFSANGGITTKLRLLALESAVPDAPAAFDGDGAFGFDPEVASSHLRSADPRLGELIDSVGPFRMQLQKTPSVFGALAEAIVFQQLNGKAAATIFARLCALFPDPAQGVTPERILRASEARLRSAGLSGSKLLALKDLAQKTKDGVIPSLAQLRELPEEQVIERLTEVRGVGKWTVEMLLIFRLGRPDVLPLDDFGVRKGFALTFGLPELPGKKELEKHGERWRPYRSVASWYLWRATDPQSKS